MIKEDIKEDLKRYYKIELNGNMDPSVFDIIRLILDKPGLQATLIYRFGRLINTSKSTYTSALMMTLYPLYAVLSWLSRYALGISISLDAEIGRGFYINHFGGIEIDACKIGENCSVHQLVKIMYSAGAKQATIGNDVWIGPHSIIEAGKTIESGSTVAAGAYINSDFPENVLIMGSPGRIVAQNYNNSQLL